MRLIDADALMEYMDECKDKNCPDTFWATGYAKSFIESAPTVGAVMHSKWVVKRGNYITGGGNPLYCCHLCGHVWGASMMPPKDKYCPECGAKMDGDAK